MWPMFDEHLVNIVGGCCGTHDGHMRALAQLVETAPGCFVSPRIPGKWPATGASGNASTSASLASADSAPSVTPLQQAILSGKVTDATPLVQKMLADGLPGTDIINEMIGAMGILGKRFEEGKAFVPQLLMAGKTMKAAIALIKEYQTAHGGNGQMESLGKVVVGTVKGDLHDIGKNLVISMLEGSGFEVIDLGIDVPAEKFVEAVKREHADILSMSALLTTTMTYMPEVIRALEEAGIRQQIKVMIGGAPVTQEFCDRIGADAYTDNANQAVACAKELMKKK
ncbi:MAG: cobalamin-dependent protein [Bacteroidales bacterium]|nr:cobalamin-dependent protein [Bacteroidales bacterium]